MPLSLFWSRYTLELRNQHIRDVDALYQYVIAQERWNWFLAKIPEQEQIKILRGHNHGEGSWTCRKWLDHMLEWIKENKPAAVYDAMVERIDSIAKKSVEDLERQAVHSLSSEELKKLQDAGYFQCVVPPRQEQD